MSRPTQEIIDDAEWQEIGRCGCLLPDAEATQGDCSGGEDAE